MNYFDLKEFRVNYAKMTQSEFAKRLDVSQDRVSRWESNPESISMMDYMAIAKMFRMSLDDLMNFKLHAPKSISPDFTWKDTETEKKKYVNYLNSQINTSEDDVFANKKAELLSIVQHNFRKPKIGLVGHSDAGKSTIINALLGNDKLPVSWTPTTYIAVFIKHINDKPEFIKNNVVLFHNTSSNRLIEDWRIDEKEYFDCHCAIEGDYDLLKEYGTRMGESASEEISSAVVYIDSPALLNCDFVDLPGFGTGDVDSDDKITEDIIEKKLDVVIYMSSANGFLKGDDLHYVKNILRKIDDLSAFDYFDNPLSNIFIVGSQADFIQNNEDRENILDEGCKRLMKTLSDGFWNHKKQPKLFTNEVLRSRFFMYSTENNEISERLLSELTKTIETLPKIINKTAEEVIEKWLINNDLTLQKQMLSYRQLLNERETRRSAYNERILNEPKRKEKFNEERDKIVALIKEHRKTSLDHFGARYDDLIDSDVLEGRMRSRGVERNKESIQDFGEYVVNTLEDEYTNILSDETKIFKGEMDNFFNKINTNEFAGVGVSIDGLSGFSAESVFASGIAGLGTFGALAFWASTCGNLGGYILIAKGLGVLGSLGISLGSAAGVMAAVASIGGPVVLGIAAAVGTALAVLFGRNWRKDTAKKIIKSLKEKDAKKLFIDAINQYWDDTLKSFNAGVDNIEKEWEKSLEEERDLIENYNDADINNLIVKLTNIQTFFRDFPLQMQFKSDDTF